MPAKEDGTVDTRVSEPAKDSALQIMEIVLIVIVLGAITLSAIGLHAARAAHAPDWAYYLFSAVIAVSTPVAVIIGYFLHPSPRGKISKSLQLSRGLTPLLAFDLELDADRLGELPDSAYKDAMPDANTMHH